MRVFITSERHKQSTMNTIQVLTRNQGTVCRVCSPLLYTVDFNCVLNTLERILEDKCVSNLSIQLGTYYGTLRDLTVKT